MWHNQMVIINQLKKNCSENKFLDKSSGVMAGSLNMSNNKITHLAKPTDDNGRCIDNNYLKLSGGTMNGNIILNSTLLLSQYQALSWTTGNAFFVQITNPFIPDSIWSKRRSSILETRLMLLT